MNIIKRPYKLLSDFEKVYEFLSETYTLNELNNMMLPQFFEYAHTHPAFNHKLTHRMTLWENEEKIVAFCGYEMDIGETFLIVSKGYQHLLAEMLIKAELELSIQNSIHNSLSVWIINTQEDHKKLLQNSGYANVHTEPVRIFRYENLFRNVKLPDGFKRLTLCEENNLSKLHKCLHHGFNHEGEPDGNIDNCRLMQSGPNFRFDLSSIIKAPNGDYACYAGMWFDEKNKYAYLEPLCTIPEYRKMGLAAYTLTETMKKTMELGATYCFGGVPEFYTSIGFETICNRELWKKEW